MYLCFDLTNAVNCLFALQHTREETDVAIADYISKNIPRAHNEEDPKETASLSIRLPKKLAQELELIASEIGVSRHKLMVEMVTEGAAESIAVLREELEPQDLEGFEEVMESIHQKYGA